MEKVSQLRVESSSDLETVCGHLKKAMDLLGGIESFVKKNSRVLLKPNCGSLSSPKEGRNTDPRIIEAMVILLKEAGIHDIIIGESSIIGTDTRQVFREMGLDRIAGRHDVMLVDFKKESFIKKSIPDSLVLSHVKVFSVVDEVDAIINLPKLKTISSVPVSFGLKNFKGLIPDSEKKRFHHTDLSRSIVDLNKVVTSQLTIIDGIIACEFYEPRETGIIFAGGNALATDSVAARAIGIDPANVDYLFLAAKAGLGSIGEEAIEIFGDSLPEGLVDFRRAPEESGAFSDLFPEVTIIDGKACSGCASALYVSLKAAKERGFLEQIPDLTLALGPDVENIPDGKRVLCLGNCTGKIQSGHFIVGCPFTSMEFIEYLESEFL
jgi:uncharacterized protein (DUF362 family)